MKIVSINSIRLPSKAEINVAYNQGFSAIVVLMQETFLALAERIEKVEDQLA